MIIYVHSHDIFDRGRTFARHRSLTDVEHITVPAGACMGHIANSIVSVAQNERSIWLLILNSHGGPGTVSIGAGLDAATVFHLAPVRTYMTPGGRGVEIHACNVASEGIALERGRPTHSDPRPYGEEFIQRMAYTLGCPVRASRQFQSGYASSWGIPHRGNDDYGRFEGDMVLVQPNGAASLHRPGL
ncbi:MAG: hypothetical protein HKM95_00590 [Inquilinus sp.]|nr:hypothetical protein [Inquilinus sp.]